MENKTLYVGNLAYSADEQDLDIAFSEYGCVDDIKLMRDRESGRSRGFAFITYSKEEEAAAAMAMNGKELAGRPLRVNTAKERA
ncbi:RNA-binding protein [Candidatus Sororendozoicomonas aggregata]|uniref:RNA recognition motif domain-containing protein n=1 Tax=Candidatus Sororendozoicomonas aggregata TaxID=3073239 RepID=UPI002ED1C96A